jgi:glycosyltransferase involved in cell wall biosynthesis
MLLIDAIYINTGGGMVLLEYLIENLNLCKTKVCYLLDNRIAHKNTYIKESDRIIYMKSSVYSRYKFYKKNKNVYDTVFCLGNIPPLTKLNSKVYTYFHNSIFIKVTGDFNYFERVKYVLKVFLIKKLARNTDEWWVQTESMKNRFRLKFKEENSRIKVLPFFSQIKKCEKNILRAKNTYIYVSNATPNKNHLRLINAFCSFYDDCRQGKLLLTVNKDYVFVIQEINDKIMKGYPIENLGYVDRNKLNEVYESCEYIVFPSLEESFGLGLIEAIESGCKVLGADLSYTYQVCEPSIVFDPLNESSILNAFNDSLDGNIKESKILVKNEIKSLLRELCN